jgi:hypothetical protein
VPTWPGCSRTPNASPPPSPARRVGLARRRVFPHEEIETLRRLILANEEVPCPEKYLHRPITVPALKALNRD